jgi:hypothetical protein
MPYQVIKPVAFDARKHEALGLTAMPEFLYGGVFGSVALGRNSTCFGVALEGRASPLVEFKSGFLERAGDLIELNLTFRGVTNVELEQTRRHPECQS